jgi:dienelactone hydrolase
MVIIPPMPLNLAVFSPEKAQEIIAAYPEIQSWAIGGHSLGGSMAANFARKRPDQIQGLIFWAAYPASSDNLAGQEIVVASIYATLDGLATVEEVLASASLLPAGTSWTPIEGGNHAQFGWYGDQPGDNPAAISREEQQQQVIEASLTLLEQLAGDME